MHPLLDPFEKHCADRATHVAAGDELMRCDYRTFRGMACGLASRIAARTQRERVGILVPTSATGAIAIYACWYAGQVPVPLNFLLAPDELARIIRDAELDLVVTIARFAPAVEAAGVQVLLLDEAALEPGPGQVPDVANSDVAAVIYTSGTTSDPKGVCLTFDNLASNVAACVTAAQMSPDMVFLSVLPQFHAFGFTANMLVPLTLGASVHYRLRFSPVTMLAAFVEERVSVLITVASMYGALAAMKNATREQFASLTMAVSGGEPLPMRVAQTFEERFGVRIDEGYGMTEASPVVTLNTARAHRAGSVGRPLPGVTVTAVDDQGKPVAAGEPGQLVVRGHCVMQKYLNKPAETAAVLREGGLWTGDIGCVDADGFVSITGRAREMIIVGGENVIPYEIESVLVEHVAVAEAAVIGVTDPIRGELPVAFVHLKEGALRPSEAELRGFCRGHLAGYKVPRRIHVADDLPRGPTGKILKRALQERLS